MNAQQIINASYSDWKSKCEPVVQQMERDAINHLFWQCADHLDGDIYAEFSAYLS
jgi:hypothetical protein